MSTRKKFLQFVFSWFLGNVRKEKMAARVKIAELKTFFGPLLEKGILSKPEFLKFCTGSVAENIDPQGWNEYP